MLAILQYVMVPITQDSDALAGKKISPISVICRLRWRCMLAAIEFDGELGFKTIEIQNVGTDTVLAAEFQAA